MHEFATISSVVEAIMDFATERKLIKILEVKLEIGDLTMLGIEQMKFCYGAITKDTVLEGSKLTIEEVAGKVKCKECKYEGKIGTIDNMLYHVTVPTLQCPRCGKTADVTDGNQCKIKTLKFQELH
jgi:hydrogenase nickel incorporation protein HypA/HybF